MHQSNAGSEPRSAQSQQNYPQNPASYGRGYNMSHEQNYPQNPTSYGRGHNRSYEQNDSNDYRPGGRGYNRSYEQKDSDYRSGGRSGGRGYNMSYEQNDSYNYRSGGRGYNRSYDQNDYYRSGGRGHNRFSEQKDSNDYRSGGRGYNRFPEKKDDFYISKNLSTILRHTAEKLKLKFDPEGYLYVKDILLLDRFHGVTDDDIARIVRENDKQRFSLKEEESTGKLKIRANQGHSVKFECLDVGLKPILDPEEYPNVLHGTYFSYWVSIKKEGLKRMSRVHIHFAAGLPGEDGVISGMRSSCEVLIYLDLKKAIEDGLKFFLSANNVILSSGNEDGVIAPKYFKDVLEWKSGSFVSLISEGHAACQKKKNLPVGMSPVDDSEKKERTKKNKGSKKNKSKPSSEKESVDPRSHKREKSIKEDDVSFEKKKKTRTEIDKGISPPDHWDSAEELESPSEDVKKEEPTPKGEESHEKLNLCPSEDDVPKSKNENESKKLKKIKANKDKTSLEDVKPSIENKMEAKSEEEKEPEKLKEAKSLKETTEETKDSDEEYPLVIVIIINEDKPNERQMKHLREQRLIGITVLKKSSAITHLLITSLKNVFIFDVGTVKKYLKAILEDIHCTKVMFDSNLVSELYKQMGISMYKTPIADMKILAEKFHQKNFNLLSELIGEKCGKIPSPEPNGRYQIIATQSCGKMRTVMKNLAQVAKMLPFFEDYKSLMDESMGAAIFDNYDKDFDEKTRVKLTKDYEKKTSQR